MKFNLTFKTNDVCDQLEDDFSDSQLETIKEKLEKWIDYGEYVTIEFDLEKGVAKVLEA